MMKSTLFSSGGRLTANCEGVNRRNGAYSSGHVVASESCQTNCRHGFSARHSSGSFHDMTHNVHEPQNEPVLRGADRVQVSPKRRAPVHHACSCSQHLPEPFRGHDHQHLDEKSCHHMPTGPLHNGCELGCCGPSRTNPGRSTRLDSAADRTLGTNRSSLSSDSLEFQRNATAFGCRSHLPSMVRDGETRSSSVHATSMCNSLYSSPTKPSKKQVILYGWFLMKSVNDNCNEVSSSTSGVAIGGYTCPRMADANFVATGPIVQRLERWKLLTSDGLEVGLMGMINIVKSVSNGFSPSLVQCFMIGFPSSWIYMLLNLNGVTSKGSCPGISSPAASPGNSQGDARDMKNIMEECSRLFKTSRLEADPIKDILKSSLFGAPQEKERTATIRKFSSTTASPLRDGDFDVNSLPPSHEEENGLKDEHTTCRDAGFLADNLRQHPQIFTSVDSDLLDPVVHTRRLPELMDCPPARAMGAGMDEAREVPESSSQTQTLTKSWGPLSGTKSAEVEAVGEVPKIVPELGLQHCDGVVHSEVSSGRTEFPAENLDATAVGAVVQADIPCTPLQTTINRSRDSSNVPVSDNSTTEPSGDPERTLQNFEKRRLRSHTSRIVMDEPVTEAVVDLDRTIQNLGTRLWSPTSKTVVDEPVPQAVIDPDNIPTEIKESDTPTLVANTLITEVVVDALHGSESMEDQVGPSSNAKVKVEEVELKTNEECSEEETIITEEDYPKVNKNQLSKGTAETKQPARKKRLRVSRNYYQSRKRRSSAQSSHSGKETNRLPSSVTSYKRCEEETKVERDKLRPPEEIMAPPRILPEEADRSLSSRGIDISRRATSFTSCQGWPESSQRRPEKTHAKSNRQTRNSIVPPPLPSPRVADKSEVTEAFGLKRSLHGRVLVPPLETWRSQSIKYDMDGGIIAISDGFTGSEAEPGTGCYKPPSDKGAQTMQRKLRKAAGKCSR